MQIVEAPNRLIYDNPRRFIEKHVLPLRVVCGQCNSKLTLDFVSDIRERGGRLVYECLICHTDRRVMLMELDNAYKIEKKILAKIDKGYYNLSENHDLVLQYYRDIEEEKRQADMRLAAELVKKRVKEDEKREREIYHDDFIYVLVLFAVVSFMVIPLIP